MYVISARYCIKVIINHFYRDCRNGPCTVTRCLMSGYPFVGPAMGFIVNNPVVTAGCPLGMLTGWIGTRWGWSGRFVCFLLLLQHDQIVSEKKKDTMILK